MIAFRVKAPFQRLAPLLLTLAVACSGARPSAPQPPVAPELPAGSEGWTDGALLLPARSPAVLVARLDQLLDGASRLKAWILAEPAMLGPDGEDTVRALENGWAAATAYIGVDPLKPSVWVEHGVDPTRAVYIGMYPVQTDGDRFVASVDTTIREETGVPPGEPISPSLRALAEAGGTLPEGTNARILRSVAESRPLGGIRAVIPVASRGEFSTTASAFAEGMGFRAFPDRLTATIADFGVERAFWSSTGVPAVSLRFEDSYAVLDVIFPAFLAAPRSSDGGSSDLPALLDELRRALDDLPAGRPEAPTPTGDPSLALTFDQAEMSKLVRLRGYRASLEGLHTAGTARRDSELLGTMLAAVSEAESWLVGADDLTGTTFGLHIGNARDEVVARVNMTMFARHGLPLVDTGRSVSTLGIPRQAAAIGIDFATLREPSWKQWFADEGTTTELAALDFDVIPRPQAVLPAVRAATMVVSNFGDVASVAQISDDLSTTLDELEGVSRLEIVGLSPDVGEFRQHPEIVCAVVMEPGGEAAAMQRVQSAVGGVLLGWFGPQADVGTFPRLTAGTTNSMPTDYLPVHQHLVQGPQNVAIFGVGMDVDAFNAQVATLESKRAGGGVVEARLEPVALLSWLRADDADIFDPVDANILAQRLGALTLRYQSVAAGTSQGLDLELELHAPPRL